MTRQDSGNIVQEPIEAHARDRRDGAKWEPFCRAETFKRTPALLGVRQLGLAARDDLGTGRQLARVRGQFTLDDAPVLYGVAAAARIEIDQMHEDARPLG